MILITKNKEPKEWTEYRNPPGVDYKAIPELVQSLLKEPGYICAYCMRRIPTKDKIYEKDGVNFVYANEDHRVEHIKSLSLIHILSIKSGWTDGRRNSILHTAKSMLWTYSVSYTHLIH